MTQTFQIINGDVAFSSATGRPLLLSGNTKLSQDLKEAGEIATQSNGFGFGLEAVIGLVGDAVSLRVAISRKVRDGIVAMMRLQQQFQRSQRTTDEIIAKLVRVIVTPILKPDGSETAATAYAYRYDVQTVKGLSSPNSTPTTTTGVIIQ